MDRFIEELLERGADAGPLVLVLVAFVLAFAETGLFTDLLVPGEIGMVLLGATVSRAELPIVLVIVAASIGATLGDSVGWFVGARVGRRLTDEVPFLRRHLHEPLERADAYFAERGAAVVFWGRFVGALRGVVSFVAGTAGMPYRRFLPWNALASVCWCTLVITAGYLFGRNVDAVMSDAGLAVTIGVVVGAAFWLLRRRRRTRADHGG